MIIYIDLVDTCNLHCKTCVRGRGEMKRSSNKMALGMCNNILKKAVAEGINTVGFYNWTEPGLVSDLYKYVRLAKKNRLQCMLSTNLSFENIRPLKQAMVNGADLLMVSVSGFDQNTYEINHVGGDINLVKNNLQHLAEFKKLHNLKTQINLRFIQFNYNKQELKKLQGYATQIGVVFEVISGSGNPREILKSPLCSESVLLEQIKVSSLQSSFRKTGEACSLLFDHLAIDARGDVFICCGQPTFDYLKIGPYLKMPSHRILFERYIHPLCRVCTCETHKVLSETEKNTLVEALRKSLY